MNVPLLFPLVAFIAGIILAELGVGFWPGLALIAIALIFYVVLLRISRSPLKAYKINQLHRVWVFLLCMGAGTVCCDLRRPQVVAEDMDAVVSGRIESRQATVYGDRLVLDVTGLRTGMDVTHPTMKLIVYAPPLPFSEGDFIDVRGTISPLKDSPDRLPSGYAESMLQKGISGSMYVKEVAEESVAGGEDVEGRESGGVRRVRSHGGVELVRKGTGLLVWAREIREGFDIFISHTLLAKDTKAFVKALAIGERDEMSDSHRQSFADAGIAHTLALSGLHVGIILMVLMWILSPLTFVGGHNLRYVLAILLLWSYAVIAGFSPTIVRATVMATCALVALTLQRKRSALNALCAAVFFLVILDPLCVFDVGLQLSAACVAGILIFTERLNPFRHRESPLSFTLASAILTTLVATLVTWPISAYYFRSFPTMFLPVNLIVLPLLPAYVVVAMSYLLLCAFGLEWPLLRGALDLGYESFRGLASFLGDGSALSVNISGFTLSLWFAGVSILAYSIMEKRRHGRMMVASGIWMMVLSVVTIPYFVHQAPSGFIVGREAGRIIITSYDGGEKTRTVIPRRQNHLVRIDGKRIVVVDDASVSEEGLDWEEPDILVLGGDYQGPVDELLGMFRPGLLLLHPSIRPKSEEKIREVVPPEIEIHSLRNDGAYHCFRQPE